MKLSKHLRKISNHIAMGAVGGVLLLTGVSNAVAETKLVAPANITALESTVGVVGINNITEAFAVAPEKYVTILHDGKRDCVAGMGIHYIKAGDVQKAFKSLEQRIPVPIGPVLLYSDKGKFLGFEYSIFAVAPEVIQSIWSTPQGKVMLTNAGSGQVTIQRPLEYMDIQYMGAEHGLPPHLDIHMYVVKKAEVDNVCPAGHHL